MKSNIVAIEGDLPAQFDEIFDFFATAGFEHTTIFGGALRDHFRQAKIKDYDVIIHDERFTVKSLLSRKSLQMQREIKEQLSLHPDVHDMCFTPFRSAINQVPFLRVFPTKTIRFQFNLGAAKIDLHISNKPLTPQQIAATMDISINSVAAVPGGIVAHESFSKHLADQIYHPLFARPRDLLDAPRRFFKMRKKFPDLTLKF